MDKALKDMTLAELWELFPIVLTPHRSEWEACAAEEIGVLSALLDAYHPVISHIGSTAIPGIAAKPVIDILIEIAHGDCDRTTIKELMEAHGYICMSLSDKRMSFNKGYTPRGYADKVFHIHVHAPGDRDEILFRDYLIAHPDTAKEYERLKLSLLPAYTHDRDGYTEAKTEFIRRIISKAKGNTHIR